MSIIDGIGLAFDEMMSGFFSIGQTEPARGAELGKKENSALKIEVTITIDNLETFLHISEHDGRLAGTITFQPLGTACVIRSGSFNLFSVDAVSSHRRMVYEFTFTGNDQKNYFFHGQKEVVSDHGVADVLKDMTTLHTTIYRVDGEQKSIYGAGQIYFDMKNAPAMASSMRIIGNATLWQQVAGRCAFLSFAYGELREEYLKNCNPWYTAHYENLLINGTVKMDGGQRPFFFVSGAHEKGFPWGDNEVFWDCLLIVGNDSGGYDRFCITERILEGLHINVKKGIYSYHGPIYKLTGEGYTASFSQIARKKTNLIPYTAEIELSFKAVEQGLVSFPFPTVRALAKLLNSSLAKAFRQALPSEHPMGTYITMHTVNVENGAITLRPDTAATSQATQPIHALVDAGSFGEAECGTFCNTKEPTLLYHYVCSLRPKTQSIRTEVHSSALRNEREHWIKDQIDSFLGSLIKRVASAEIVIEKTGMTVTKLQQHTGDQESEQHLIQVGEPLLELANDHFPTGVFYRRIIEVTDSSTQERSLAMEEDMSLLRCEAINSTLKTTVAAIRDNASKFKALDTVLALTNFDAIVQRRCAETLKSKDEFSIVIKPNFMFSYDRNDHSTYTDPALVGHLVKHVRDLGFCTVALVEAHSTYGEYFDKRSVREMAEYLGFDGKKDGYAIVDMTQDATVKVDFGGALGLHPVSPAWRDADFRISFAKNKTHSYAYYTLTLKNIYGALPLANKFKEYHCKRGIYKPAIEYLAAFPVHFGLIDAYSSADGPFGVFADPRPNGTATVIGGENLVAVDWVGASKMGINPMISMYMRLAVEQFGKPEINLIGDSGIYLPWLNVPVALNLFTHKGIDASYHFGNLFYASFAQMDMTHFTFLHNPLHLRILRAITNPLRRMFFVRTGENPSLLNRFLSWVLWKLGF
ncbi:MAG: DUF362 domain-containing protein [Chitinivibrionales bacterium]|nr:DUF362 domain-containing protein [Chitinivibrionales bacterium]